MNSDGHWLSNEVNMLSMGQPGITTRREIITLVHFGKRVDVTV